MVMVYKALGQSSNDFRYHFMIVDIKGIYISLNLLLYMNFSKLLPGFNNKNCEIGCPHIRKKCIKIFRSNYKISKLMICDAR